MSCLAFVVSSVCYVRRLLCPMFVMSIVCYVCCLIFPLFVMSAVCYVCRLLCPVFFMSAVWFVRRLLCTVFVMSSVCYVHCLSVQGLSYLLFVCLGFVVSRAYLGLSLSMVFTHFLIFCRNCPGNIFPTSGHVDQHHEKKKEVDNNNPTGALWKRFGR